MAEPKDKLKIVEEEESPEEEVVRLDAPRKKPLEKQGKMAPEVIGRDRPQPAGPRVPESEKDSSEWQGQFGGSKRKAIPTGWFYLVGLVLAGVVGWMVVQIVSDEGDTLGLAGETAPGPGDRAGSGDSGDRQAAIEDFEKLQSVVTGFLAAKTIEERLDFVRHPERVKPLMEDYYGRNSFRSFTLDHIDEVSPVALDLRSFMVMALDTEEEAELPILVEDAEEGPLVDWESFVCYQPISPERFLAERPAEPMTFRVYASLDHFFVYQFADEKKFGCVRLEFRGSDVVLFGYVERGSVVEQKFNQILKQKGKRQRQPMILTVKFPEECKEERCVIVEDVEGALWAFPGNPEDEPGS